MKLRKALLGVCASIVLSASLSGCVVVPVPLGFGFGFGHGGYYHNHR